MTHVRSAAVLLSLALVVTTAACGSSDSLDGGRGADDSTIVVGSQDYYSNEILAEIYAQALEAEGIDVKRDFRIGQREVYVSEIEDGSIDLFPEYTGPLLQYWQPDTEARLADDVYGELTKAAPTGVDVLDQSDASDQDSYVVTREFAEQYGVTSVADLADVPVPLVLGGNSEGENRPNGPRGLAAVYGVDVDFTPIEDGGGPLTLKALRDGDIQLAIIYTADPAIANDDLVVLDDPEGLFLASHVVPVASDQVGAQARETIDAVSAAMSAADLVALNTRSVTEQSPASTIARDWLSDEGLA